MLLRNYIRPQKLKCWTFVSCICSSVRVDMLNILHLFPHEGFQFKICILERDTLWLGIFNLRWVKRGEVDLKALSIQGLLLFCYVTWQPPTNIFYSPNMKFGEGLIVWNSLFNLEEKWLIKFLISDGDSIYHLAWGGKHHILNKLKHTMADYKE